MAPPPTRDSFTHAKAILIWRALQRTEFCFCSKYYNFTVDSRTCTTGCIGRRRRRQFAIRYRIVKRRQHMTFKDDINERIQTDFGENASKATTMLIDAIKKVDYPVRADL